MRQLLAGMRGALVVAVGIAAVLVPAATASAAATTTKTVPAGVVFTNAQNPADPGNCSAVVFVRSGSSWTEEASLLASGGAAGDRFGASVALKLNSAPNPSAAGTSNQRSFLFLVTMVWRTSAPLTARIISRSQLSL